MRIPLKTEQLSLGRALPWDVYDSDGRRIFRKGFIFRSQASLSRIARLQLYHERNDEAALSERDASEYHDAVSTTPARRRQVIYDFDEDRKGLAEQVNNNIFLFLDYCVATQKRISERIVEGADDQLANLNVLIDDVILAFTHAPEVCLAAVHMDYEHHLSSLQPIYTAILSLMVAEAVKLSPQARHSLVAAALTANLGMFKYVDYLSNRNSPLDEEEAAFVRAHPEASLALLRQNRVKDDVWLTAVLQHHERGDGSGYPAGLRRGGISKEASILAAADTYISMITPRAYRRPLLPKVAMQQIYKTAVASDDLISIGLIKQLGIYPPGSLVRLANQEIAVVLERNRQDVIAPIVAAIGRSLEQLYRQYIIRQTNTPSYKITDAYRPEVPVDIDMNHLWRGDVPLCIKRQVQEL